MPANWNLFRRRKKTALESVWRKKREEALAWAARHYPDVRHHDTAARFVLVLEAQISVPLRQFMPDTRFLEDLGMDYLEPVEVIMAIEEEFEVAEIPNSDAQRICTVGEMIHYLFEIRERKNA